MSIVENKNTDSVPVKVYLRDVRDLYHSTGLFAKEFERLYQKAAPLIVQPRLPAQRLRTMPTSLTPRARLLLVLQWLRQYPRMHRFRALFGDISRQQVRVLARDRRVKCRRRARQVHREVRHIVPILATILNTIEWPIEPAQHPFAPMLVGALDCTSHFRVRSLNAATYYRGDKAAYFLSAQIVCDLEGRHIFQVTLLKGHNNDMSKSHPSHFRSLFVYLLDIMIFLSVL